MSLEYKKGDLFKVTGEKEILVHACNCRGRWGSGIALEFAKQFPWAYSDYRRMCYTHKDKLQGYGFWLDFRNPTIAALFTSRGYGSRKDKPGRILAATKMAIDSLLSITPSDYTINSPKINSGLFEVPWEKTEKVLKRVLKKYPNHKWIVWEKE
jgi:ADP-ribose 1''-phosphate phosphatase